MRNTPYPRYTIGHRDHRIFDLGKAPGLVQGIVDLSDAKEVKVSDLASFDHLAPGQTKTFEGEARVEVVDFGGYHGRGGFVSELKTQVLDLEADSRLTGPIAWRTVEKSADAVAEPAPGGLSTLAAFVMIGITIALFVGAAMFAVAAAVAGIGALVFMGVVLAVFMAFENGRKRNIKRLGSVYVLAPASRTWAGGALPQA